MDARFHDRTAAGRELAEALARYADDTDLLVLGLDPSGVPVACELAEALEAELDALVVRSLRAAPAALATPAARALPAARAVPAAGAEPDIIGAVAPLGVRTLDHEAIAALGLSQGMVYQASHLAQLEREARETVYRHEHPPASVEGRRVILVDDSISSGLRMQTAIRAVRQQRPSGLIVAVPVATSRARQFLEWAVDDLVTLVTLADPQSVAACYGDFHTIPDAKHLRQLVARRGPLAAEALSWS